jgi:hypothetical protein
MKTRFRLGNYLYTITLFSGRRTFIEEPVAGFRSNLNNFDVHNERSLHIGMLDFDDRVSLPDLTKLIQKTQQKYKDVLGTAYIFETSPKKYAVHFYQALSYWKWLEIIHSLNQYLDPAYCRWRMLRNNMVMRFTAKSNGYIPKLISTVETKYPKPEVEWYKDMVFNMLAQTRIEKLNEEDKHRWNERNDN